MKKLFLSALAVAALAFAGCTEDATNDLAQENGGATVELHEITFEAEIEQPSRTSLVDPGTGTSYVCWDADDAIAILTDDGKVYKATVNSEAGKPWATFSAKISGNAVAAVYPYSFAYSENNTSVVSTSNAKSKKVDLIFPNFQIYKEGSVFGDNTNAMVGLCTTGSNGMKFAMKSVMGALELKFKGSQKVQGITVKTSTTEAELSGLGHITIDDSGNNTLTMDTGISAYSYVNLEVPNVVLNNETATSFYVLVPAGTYDALQIGVMTEDGSYVRTATKPHTVKAGEIKPINCGNLDTMIDKTSAVDLSKNGYSNCYVVVPDGSVNTYSFETKLVDGTAAKASTHLESEHKNLTNKAEALMPHMAQILWAEDTQIAYDIFFDRNEGKIYFKNDGKALGNMRIILTCDPFESAEMRYVLTGATNNSATDIDERYRYDLNSKLISFKRADICSIWYWHIWSTPSTPETCIALSSTAVDDGTTAATLAKAAKSGMMDRNLGATWTAKNVNSFKNMDKNNAVNALGLYYQAGNMHPYPRPVEFGNATEKYSNWARAKYQYGFHSYCHTWSHSSSAKTDLGDNLQMPYHAYTVDYTPSDSYTTTDGETRKSWLKIPFRVGGAKGSGNSNVPILWSNNFKTNYDPCPVGWKVPHQGNVYHFLAGEKKTIAGKTGKQRVVSHFATLVGDGTNYYGQYVSFNGTDAYFIPAGGFMEDNQIKFNYNNLIGYYWGAPYSDNTLTRYNVATKAVINSDPYSNYSTNFWGEVSSRYQLRCIKYDLTTTAATTAASYNVDEATGF